MFAHARLERNAHKSRAMENAILDRAANDALRSSEEKVSLKLGEILLAPEEAAEWIYFPLTCVASCVRRLLDGSMVEVGLIGYEGLVGIHSLFDAESQPNEVSVQIAGEAIRVPLQAARHAFDSGREFRQLLLRYANSFATQAGQGAACNRLHPLEQRLARWLLMLSDRTRESTLRITQEFIAQMLGTRTAGVNEAVGSITNSGLITHRRGSIEIIDRDGLEQASCECYGTIRDAYVRDGVIPR